MLLTIQCGSIPRIEPQLQYSVYPQEQICQVRCFNLEEYKQIDPIECGKDIIPDNPMHMDGYWLIEWENCPIVTGHDHYDIQDKIKPYYRTVYEFLKEKYYEMLNELAEK
jgi:hypothetical protein